MEPIGQAGALRMRKFMEGRKVLKVHQNILVFYKGNTKEIKNIFPKVDFDESLLEVEVEDDDLNNTISDFING